MSFYQQQSICFVVPVDVVIGAMSHKIPTLVFCDFPQFSPFYANI